MRAFLFVAIASCAAIGTSGGIGYPQENTSPKGGESRKWFCTVEKAAGVMPAKRDAKGSTATAINFNERHKKFILTIKHIVRSQLEREMCRANLAYWMPILAAKGTFDETDHPNLGNTGGDIGKFSDYRYNIGKNCFASDEATLKFFDREGANTLVSYDFLSEEFVGLPGNWLKLYADEFEAGETLDAGPVVFTGKCERI
jgi:hypothetical protein